MERWGLLASRFCHRWQQMFILVSATLVVDSAAIRFDAAGT